MVIADAAFPRSFYVSGWAALAGTFLSTNVTIILVARRYRLIIVLFLLLSLSISHELYLFQICPGSSRYHRPLR